MNEGGRRTGSALEVGRAFLKLGLTSFGGPIAHLGYFRHEFVVRRRWLGEAAFSETVALCQFLPGPTSSQVGICVGLGRAGWGGALAAWLAFTAPSAAAMLAFALLAPRFATPAGGALVHGLGLAAVAVVLQAVTGMARAHCADRGHALVAVAAALLVLLAGSGLAQLAAIAGGALVGLRLRDLRATDAPLAPGLPIAPRTGWAALGAYAALLVVLPLLATRVAGLGLFAACYRAGALVFGGGHVVLPLLREAVVPPGWLPEGDFLAGYGAAQALPGPLFSFAAYLGALAHVPPGGAGGALLALAGIFLPGILALVAAVPFWAQLRRQPAARGAIAGANAAVVGVLAAALVSPIAASAIGGATDLAIAALGAAWLMRGGAAPVAVVAFSALGGLVAQSLAGV